MKCSYPTCPHANWPSPWEEIQPSVESMLPDSEPHRCTRLHVPRLSNDFQYKCRPVSLQEPTERHSLVVMTAPRRHETLSTTLHHLERAGLDRWLGPKHVVSDGPLQDLQSCSPLPDGVLLHESTSQRGSARTFVRSLQEAIDADPHLDYLTVLEDDISLCKNALDYIHRAQVPGDVSFVTWFTYDYDFSFPRYPTPDPHPSSSGHPVLACRSSRYFILTQACTLTRKTIDKILQCPLASENWPKTHAHDELISWVLGDALYAAHFPVLAQHLDANDSAVRHAADCLPVDAGDAQAGDRSSPYYVGDDFDASSLLRGHQPDERGSSRCE